MKIHAMTFVLCAAAAAVAPPLHAATQLNFAGNYSMRPPSHDSEDNTDRPADETWGTPEDAARPGKKFFYTGAYAYREGDYKYAVDMYEVAASWGYKPAQYNLAVMYLKGDGIAVDRPRAMAWAALAAERGDPTYVQARELLYADLSKDEWEQANTIWRDLRRTFGDEVALPRAKARWAQVRASMTGSRVGGVGPLMIGAANAGGKMTKLVSPLHGDGRPEPKGPKGSGNSEVKPGNSSINGFATAAFGVLGGGGEDGSVAYRQLWQSDDPYDPKFEWRPASGTSHVGEIQPLDGRHDATQDDGETPPQQDH
ncbi:MAG: tetratricopeptide repeat protein [Dokdonella sp.]|uniref:tetratricopeptide repeat protein n=1 Tax=Dokdonella sp. TaxID=2291710 RepID=UPI003F7DD8FB